MLTAEQIRRACRRTPDAGNLNSVLIALERYGPDVGLDALPRQAAYVAQMMHESGEFKYDREVWGPTDAQKRYEGRADLGNTVAGDGSRFRGRAGIQVTGRANYREFTAWARKRDPAAPDFEASPDLVNSDPWEGLAPIWYWETRGLNRYADAGDHEMLTRRINGGLNGYADRLECYTRLALVALGRAPYDVRGWQAANGLSVDGIAGPATRSSLHAALGRSELAPAPTVPVQLPVLRRGDWGGEVFTLQELLNGKGAALRADADFGAATQAAVIALQRRRSLTADGVVGRNTWAALIAA